MKDLKPSTKQRFVALEFDYPDKAQEVAILQAETGIGAEPATTLVELAHTARNLKGHGLVEGVSTRLLVYAAQLMAQGIAPQAACRMALVRPITDDADIRQSLDHAIDAIWP